VNKISLDYHGVITANPKLFSTLTKVLCRFLGYEIHVVTGSRITDALKEQLKLYDISYTHFFSISDYHHHRGTPMTGYEDHQPKIADDIWDQTKALYCRDRLILLHIDDSEVYGKYFTTPYILFKQIEGEPTFTPISQTIDAVTKKALRLKEAFYKWEEITDIAGDMKKDVLESILKEYDAHLPKSKQELKDGVKKYD
jgi:hypothetical protein